MRNLIVDIGIFPAYVCVCVVFSSSHNEALLEIGRWTGTKFTALLNTYAQLLLQLLNDNNMASGLFPYSQSFIDSQ